MQNKEGVKGHYFFMEDDMKRAAGVLRMDKSGKILLTILRHLGRLQEVQTSCSSPVATALARSISTAAHTPPEVCGVVLLI